MFNPIRNEKYCKVTEELLKLTYTLTKSSPAVAAAADLLTPTLFTLLGTSSTNPSILSPLLKLLSLQLLRVLTGPLNKEALDLFLEVTNLLAEYSPMQHKEQVRIAVSKALARLLPLVDRREEALFPGQLRLLKALVILLNDEQPDIRYYLSEAQGINAIIEGGQEGRWKVMGQNVQLNDQVVVEYLFEEFTTRILTSQPELLSAYA